MSYIGLKTKTLLYTAGFATLLVAVACAATIVWSLIDHRRREIDHGAAVARLLSERVARLLQWDDRVSVRESLEQTVKHHRATAYAFVVREGRPYAHAFREGVPRGLLALQEAGRDAPLVRQVKDRAGAIYYDIPAAIENANAFLHLGLSQNAIDQEFKPYARGVALAGAAALLLGLLLAVEVTRRVGLQVDRLTETLRKSEEKYRFLAETTNDWIWETDASGVFTYCSPQVKNILGYDAEDLLGKAPFEFMPSGESERAAEFMRKTMEKGQAFSAFQCICLHKNGRRVAIEMGGAPSLDEKGKLQGCRGVNRDATESRKAMERLRASEARYRALFDGSRDAFMTLAPPDWKFTSANAATVEMFRAGSVEKFTVLGPWDVSPERQPDGRPSAEKAREMIEKAMKEGSHFFEWRHQRVTGEEFPATVLLSAVEWDGRRILQAIVRDVTEQKKVAAEAEAARKKAEREALKLRSMIEGMDEGVVVADANDVVTDVNQWFLDHTGLQRGDLVGASMWSFHPDTEGTTRLRAAIRRFRAGGSRETLVVQRELLGMHLSLRAQPIFQDGRYRGCILNVIDVTDLVEARQSAEAATRAKSAFLANMSHEIRTPMTAILGFNDIVLESVDDPGVLDAARIVKRNGEHLLELINDILDISKIESGKMEVERIAWPPRQVLADVLSLLRVRADEKNLTLREEYDGPIPETITTDPARLRQILINIVGNAIKFTESGSVRVVARLAQRDGEEPKLQFDVIDTGIGIGPDQIDELFEAFAQADGSASRRFEGTGLGLAISRQLARKLGGDVTATSEPGKGSVFRVTVGAGDLTGVRLIEYVREGPAIADPRLERAADAEERLDCRVLLAEDTPDSQELLTAFLSGAGADVTIACNGREAVEKALAGCGEGDADPGGPPRPFDVVLMDVQMPVLNGLDATRRLRRQGYDGPIIALTAHAMHGDRQKCLAAGCTDYLTKPVTREELVRTVAKWSAAPAADRETAMEMSSAAS